MKLLGLLSLVIKLYPCNSQRPVSTIKHHFVTELAYIMSRYKTATARICIGKWIKSEDCTDIMGYSWCTAAGIQHTCISTTTAPPVHHAVCNRCFCWLVTSASSLLMFVGDVTTNNVRTRKITCNLVLSVVGRWSVSFIIIVWANISLTSNQRVHISVHKKGMFLLRVLAASS